jgi:hypothetical protein
MANATLEEIKKKVRRLTTSPSIAQLSESELEQYINTYLQFDFPETLRLFNLKTTFSFYTLPFVDTYSTRTTNTANPMFNFTNKYITTDSPVYIAGYQALFSQSREQFYGIYPLVNSIASIGTTGDGVTIQFNGVINSQQDQTVTESTQLISLLQNNVLFSSVDLYGNGLAMQDTPITDSTTGNPTNYGLLYNALTTNEQPASSTNPNGIPSLSLAAPYAIQSLFPSSNFINYLTGEFVVSFDTAPADGVTIDSQTIPTNPTLPQALLFFDGEFVVRPVPDQSYRVDMEVFMQPTELLQNTDVPELAEWWQLIAFNAAKKILEDRNDYDTLAKMMPSLKEQENLINRRTIVQQTGQRTATIYTEQTAGMYGSGFYNGGSQF